MVTLQALLQSCLSGQLVRVASDCRPLVLLLHLLEASSKQKLFARASSKPGIATEKAATVLHGNRTSHAVFHPQLVVSGRS